ncbi:hypothetical protein Tco_0945422, partial [Tanacetum coccineum]
DHELEKVEVARHVFDEMPKLNLGVGHKVFDELPNGKVNPTSGGWFRELNGLKQISSVKEYHKNFCSILDGSKVSPECGLSCFIDGLKEEIQEMVMLFKPQTIHEACCLAKLQELTLNARKPKELIKPASLNTQNRSRKEYPEELRSVDCYAINPDFQAMLQYDAHVGRFNVLEAKKKGMKPADFTARVYQRFRESLPEEDTNDSGNRFKRVETNWIQGINQEKIDQERFGEKRKKEEHNFVFIRIPRWKAERANRFVINYQKSIIFDLTKIKGDSKEERQKDDSELSRD